MTDLEKEWNENGLEEDNVRLHDLIRELIKERDAWIYNAHQLQKQVNEMEQKLYPKLNT